MSKNDIFLKKLLQSLPPVFRKANLAGLGNERTVYRCLKSMQESGRVKRMGKDLYAKLGEDAYVVASLAYGGYIGFSSALFVRGLKAETEKRIYVCAKKSTGREFGSSELVVVGMRGWLFGMEAIGRKGETISVSTLPKTLFDMCHRPGYADFYCMYRAMNLGKFSKAQWEELLRYARMAPLSTVRRIGYIVEGKAPRWVISELGKLNSPMGVSFLYGRGGDYSRKWRIYDSEYVRRWIGEV